MAYSVYGYVYDKDCNKLANVKVYPYFKKVDSSSDNSKWTDNAYTTDSNGYYTFDVEDDNLLGSGGKYKKGTDRLYVAFVYGGDGTRSATNMTSVAFFDHTIENNEDDGKQINITIYDKRAPIIDSSSLPEDNLLTQHNYTMSETSHADYTWEDGKCNETTRVSQKYMYDLVEIFHNHTLDTTVYGWGEIAPREVSNNSSDTYKFTEAGDYHISLKVREKWDTYTIVEKDVRVKYNEPVVDFDWIPTQTNNWDGPKIKGQEKITFRNKTTAVGSDQNRVENVYTYDWKIKDKNQDGTDNTQIETGKEYTFKPTHRFQSAGTYEITLTCKWNDGFEDREVSTTKSIEIYPFRIIPMFTFPIPENRGQDIEFDPSSTIGDTDKISRYDWVIEDSYPAPDSENGLYTFAEDESSKFGEGSPDNTQEVDNTYRINDVEKPKVKFHSIGDKTAKLTITYNDGWKDVTIDKELVVTPVKYEIAPTFSISDTAPISREVEVKVNNTSNNMEIQYDIDWRFEDYYEKYNPDNSDYGNSELDNTVVLNGKAIDEEQSHRFQSESPHKIIMTLRYDNGYQRQEKKIERVVTPTHYNLVIDIATDPDTREHVGKKEVKYYSVNALDGVDRRLSESWTWNDKTFPDENDNITERRDEEIDRRQPFTWQYPSRVPFSADNSEGSSNYNKIVKLKTVYDNGWNNVSYVEVERTYEATPYEIDATIVTECNVDRYTHGENNE